MVSVWRVSVMVGGCVCAFGECACVLSLNSSVRCVFLFVLCCLFVCVWLFVLV